MTQTDELLQSGEIDDLGELLQEVVERGSKRYYHVSIKVKAVDEDKKLVSGEDDFGNKWSNVALGSLITGAQKFYLHPVVGSRVRVAFDRGLTTRPFVVAYSAVAKMEGVFGETGKWEFEVSDDGARFANGDLEFEAADGKWKFIGDMDIVGNVAVDGKVTTTDNMESDAEVKALAQGAAILLSTHTHTGNLGAPTTPPLPG